MTASTSLHARLLAFERRLYTSVRALADTVESRRAVAANRRPQPAHLLLGERGEDAAFFYLRSLGYTIVARRWRTERAPGDLDLVAWDGGTLVIVEVKARSARDFLAAEVAVDPHKQDILRRMASTYMRQFPEAHRAGIVLRFDVLAVYMLRTGTEYEHFPNAFSRTRPERYSRG